LSALNHAMQKLNKKLGSGTIMRMGEASHADRLECISSGCFTLGGWCRRCGWPIALGLQLASLIC
jgi:hypothetical protein